MCGGSQWGFLTEVGHLEFSQVADEQVLRLQVSVEDPPAVDEAERSQQLEHEDLQQPVTVHLKSVCPHFVSTTTTGGG